MLSVIMVVVIIFISFFLYRWSTRAFHRELTRLCPTTPMLTQQLPQWFRMKTDNKIKYVRASVHLCCATTAALLRDISICMFNQWTLIVNHVWSCCPLVAFLIECS